MPNFLLLKSYLQSEEKGRGKNMRIENWLPGMGLRKLNMCIRHPSSRLLMEELKMESEPKKTDGNIGRLLLSFIACENKKNTVVSYWSKISSAFSNFSSVNGSLFGFLSDYWPSDTGSVRFGLKYPIFFIPFEGLWPVKPT